MAEALRITAALLALVGLGVVAESVMRRWDVLTPETRHKGFSIIPLLFSTAFGVAYAVLAALPFNIGLFLTLPALALFDGIWGYYLWHDLRRHQ